MSWISDVADSVRALDLSTPRLRRFAFTVGGVGVALGLWMLWRGRHPTAGSVAVAASLALIGAGAVRPAALAGLYRVWMSFALALGWLMARVVLVALFSLVLTPIALVARLSGKRFLDLHPDPLASSYWVRRDPRRPPHYEKMY